MVHLDDRRDALGGAEPEHRDFRRCRHRIAVERDDLEHMARQREAADFAGAGIEHVKQHALALLHADRLAMAQHLAVDAEQVVADFVALRPRVLFVGLLADLLQLLERRADQHVHRHVAAAAEGRQKFLEHQKYLAVVGARVVRPARCRPAQLGPCRCRARDRRRRRHGYDRSAVPSASARTRCAAWRAARCMACPPPPRHRRRSV